MPPRAHGHSGGVRLCRARCLVPCGGCGGPASRGLLWGSGCCSYFLLPPHTCLACHGEGLPCDPLGWLRPPFLRPWALAQLPRGQRAGPTPPLWNVLKPQQKPAWKGNG